MVYGDSVDKDVSIGVWNKSFGEGAPCVSMNESMAVEDELERIWR